jgi:hypothetical protein
MPVVRKIRGRGVKGWVEVHGETLFTQTGDVASWSRGFSRKVTRFTASAAPSNKRPRWSHYGLPLKRTFTSSTKASPGSLKVHSAIGSTAPHAYYVDQGTGIYGGNGPYQAKILPPWARQSPSLYEHTFRVPENQGAKGEPNIAWVPVGTITVKGQKGQQFFDKGLARAFGAEGMITLQAPGTPPGMIGFPEMLANFTGNTPADAAFRAQLEEWREWRDRAWRSGRILGQGYVSERFRRELKDVRKTIRKAETAAARAEARRKASRLRSRKYRARQRALDTKPRRTKLLATQRADRARFIQAMQKKYGASNVDTGTIRRATVNGVVYWFITVRVPRPGRPGQLWWDEVRAKAKV